MSEIAENRIAFENERLRIFKTVKAEEEFSADSVCRFALGSETVFEQYSSNFYYASDKKSLIENKSFVSNFPVVQDELIDCLHSFESANLRKSFVGKSKLADCYDSVACVKKSAQFAVSRKTLSDTLFEEKRKEFLASRLKEKQEAARTAEEAAKKQSETEQAAMLALNCERDKKRKLRETVVTLSILGILVALSIISIISFCIFKTANTEIFLSISIVLLVLAAFYTLGAFLLRANCKYTVDSVGVIINGYGDANQQTSSEKKKNKKELIIPTLWYGNTVYALGANALKNSLYTKVTVGTNVRIIGENVLSGCSQLKCVVLPKSVQKIGLGAFANSPAVLEYRGSREEWEKIEKDSSANYNVRFCG